ncbi:unnamed protein product [Moneuplotes crassus]|uniref:EF-hand domain-containing protein n=1 Tax=Euplotes crassus TaxID=5936 RepID=A0AAD1XYY3_EUPCR|nr:unnamed protein product [Moneuplotes crassus]
MPHKTVKFPGRQPYKGQNLSQTPSLVLKYQRSQSKHRSSEHHGKAKQPNRPEDISHPKKTLAASIPLMEKEEKLKFCFKILDHDADGKLSIPDILHGMKSLNDTDSILYEDYSKILKAIWNKKTTTQSFMDTKQSRNYGALIGQANTMPKKFRKASEHSLDNTQSQSTSGFTELPYTALKSDQEEEPKLRNKLGNSRRRSRMHNLKSRFTENKSAFLNKTINRYNEESPMMKKKPAQKSETRTSKASNFFSFCIKKYEKEHGTLHLKKSSGFTKNLETYT